MKQNKEIALDNDPKAEVPHFLATVVTPLDKRVEMRGGLPKMCSCWSFGS